MPRKSTSSTPAGDATVSMPSNAENPANLAQEGDTSVLSVATDASTVTKPKANGKAAKEDQESLGIDDLLLPRTLTSRLARGILPANTSIQKDALLALTKAATVFVSYLAHNANELTQKKTVGPQDVLKAIQEIEMGGIMQLGATGADGKAGGRLERELEVFESVVRGKRKGYRDKVKARESGDSHLGTGGKGILNGEDEGGERETKRARYEGGDEEEEQRGTQLERSEGRVATTNRVQSSGHRRQHHQHAMAMLPATSGPATNGGTARLLDDNSIPDVDLEDEHDDHAEVEDIDSVHSEEDEGAPDGEEDEEDEEEEEEDEEEKQRADEDDLDSYGPDDQLRHDMDGGDDEDDSNGGSGDSE